MALAGGIRQFLDGGGHVVVLALSRRMTRMFELLLESDRWIDAEVRKQLVKLLGDERCELATEIAIPFLADDILRRGDAVVILDDVVISGRTLGEVCREVWLSTVEDVWIHPIAIGPDARLPEHAAMLDEAAVAMMSDVDLKEFTHYFSEELSQGALPRDIEFPLVRNTAVDFYMLTGLMRRDISMVYYAVSERACTLLIDSERRSSYNNDFAKIRGFRKSDGVAVMSYAPNLLSLAQLGSLKLFNNPRYRQVWEEIVKVVWLMVDARVESPALSISDKVAIYHRGYKTLAVMANYLFSLSMLIRHSRVFDSTWNGFKLALKDLQYLLGRRLSLVLFPMLVALMADGEVSDSTRYVVNPADMLLPSSHADDYMVAMLEGVFSADSLEEAVVNVFRAGQSVQRKRSAVLEGDFLESFASLLSKPRPFFKGPDAVIRLNVIIDRLVDGGWITPVYEHVVDEDDPDNDTLFWRRMFHASSRDFSEFKL